MKRLSQQTKATAASKALLHLRKDPIMRAIIKQTGSIPVKRDRDLYLSLMRAIVSQQLSVKAAATIWARFLGLFESGYPHAAEVLAFNDETFRSVGLSFQKAGYLRNIAQFSLDETLDYKKLRAKSDEELIAYLVRIKGVGKWTVEMLMMFSLGRPDVLPLDDLGIQYGISSNYKLRYKTKREMFSEMERVAGQWSPYRTLACRYLWRFKDVTGSYKLNNSK